MGLFLSKKEKLQKKINKLNNRYLDLLDKYECFSCNCYNDGNVEKFAERFAKCSNCTHYKEIMDICIEMDSIIEEKDKL